jgi:arginase
MASRFLTTIAASPRRVSFIGAPFRYGQRKAGVERGPALLRPAIRSVAEGLGLPFSDLGDVPAPPALPGGGAPPAGAAAAATGAFTRALADAVAGAATAGDFVLVAGGDHAVAMGSVAGALRARPGLGVLWVDAHADINTPATSPSGNLHGMPVAVLMGHCAPPDEAAFSWLQSAPPLAPGALVYVGLRDLDAGEVEAITRLGIAAFTMADVDRLGMAAVAKRALALLKGRPVHLSFDVDACDPAVAPGTGTPVPGGLSFREAHTLCEAAAASGRLVSMDVVEVNEELGGGGTTVANVASFVGSALGKVTLPPRRGSLAKQGKE